MIFSSLPNKIEDALTALQEFWRRAVDGTVPPLFVDYSNQRVLIRSTTASAATSVLEVALAGAISTGGNVTALGTVNLLSTANFYSSVNVTGSTNFLGPISATGLRAVGITSSANVDFLAVRTGGLTSTAASDVLSLRTGGLTSTAAADTLSFRTGLLTATSTAYFRSAVNVTGNLLSTGSATYVGDITASAFYGDGSQLTNLAGTSAYTSLTGTSITSTAINGVSETLVQGLVVNNTGGAYRLAVGVLNAGYNLQVGPVGGVASGSGVAPTATNTNFNIVGKTGIAAFASGTNKTIYLYSDGTTTKLDAYDYDTGGGQGLNFNIGGNGGKITINGSATAANDLTVTKLLAIDTDLANSSSSFKNGLYGNNIVKAWIRFSGTASPASITLSFNVTSLTDNGVGDWTINYGTAFANANYAIVATNQSVPGSNKGFMCQHETTNPSTSATRLFCVDNNTALDSAIVYAIAVGTQ